MFVLHNQQSEYNNVVVRFASKYVYQTIQSLNRDLNEFKIDHSAVYLIKYSILRCFVSLLFWQQLVAADVLVYVLHHLQHPVNRNMNASNTMWMSFKSLFFFCLADIGLTD